MEKKFMQRGAEELAPLLLGKLLCRNDNGQIIKARITETECYCGESDTACHAHKGRTPRTDTLYMDGGHSYVYLCYGIHSLFNVVAGREGSPEAVLLRGVEGAPGPGRLTAYLNITRGLNRIDLSQSNELWLEDDGLIPVYEAAKRVGIDYAEEADKNRLWRFILTRNGQG